MNNIYKRLAIIEAEKNVRTANSIEVLKRSYNVACDNKNYEEAASLARKIRNVMLEQSDKQMVLDRLGLKTDSVIEFISSIIKVLNNEWGVYRKKLRDLPEQSGFPFNVDFPTAPNEAEQEI